MHTSGLYPQTQNPQPSQVTAPEEHNCSIVLVMNTSGLYAQNKKLEPCTEY